MAIAITGLWMLVGCDGNSPSSGCPSLPDFLTFHAKWMNKDTVEIFYATEPLINYSERHLYWIVCRLYRSDSPEGPWEHIDTDSLYGAQDSSRLFYNVANPDRLNFFRLNVEYVCSDETRNVEGPMIATRRPVSHPDDWEAGPDLVSPVVTQIDSRGGTAISEDGTKLIAGHREGRIFDLTTGKDVTPKTATTKFVELMCAAKWIDTILYCYGGSFIVYSMRDLNEKAGMQGNFSYPIDDTTFVVHSSLRNRLSHYDIKTGVFRVIQMNYINSPKLENITTSPTYQYLGCYMESAGTPNYGEYVVLHADLTKYILVSPFGIIATHRDITRFSSRLDYRHIQWGDNDSRIYFWANWSGSQEIWTYSVSSNEYKQITGYRNSAYPGQYVANPDGIESLMSNMVTINFVYDSTKNMLLLFFRRDVYSYAMRIVPVATL